MSLPRSASCQRRIDELRAREDYRETGPCGVVRTGCLAPDEPETEPEPRPKDAISRAKGQMRDRAARAAQLEAFRAEIRPILEFYEGEIKAKPDLANRNTIAAVMLASIRNFDSVQVIERTLDRLQRIFGHDRQTVVHEQPGDFERGLKAALEQARAIRAGREKKQIEGAQAPVVIDVKATSSIPCPS